jgi:hypothetical protein
MASFVGLHNRIYTSYLDLSGLANSTTFGPVSRVMVPATTYNDGGFATVAPGLVSGEGMVSGFQDWADGVLDDELSLGQLGSQYPHTVIPNPTGTVAAGDVCWFSRGVVSSLQPFAGAVGDLAAFELALAFDTAPVQGLVAHPKAARTANGDGTAVALAGPTAAQKLYAGLHVFAYSGLTNIVVKIQSDDSSGMGSATDRITFATVSGVTSEFKSVAGSFSSETHHRVSWAVTGSGSCTFAVVFGVI